MTRKTVYAIGVFVLMAVGVQAANVTWYGSESIYWGNTNNWEFGYLPGATAVDQTLIQFGSPVTVATNFSVVTFGTDLTVRSDETLNVQADFTNWDQLRIGWNGGHVGYVNHSAGAVGAADLFVGNLSGTAAGNSIYTMTGGTLTLSDELRSLVQGEFNQSAGTTVAARFNVQAGGATTLSGGSMTLSGNMNIASGSSASVSGTGALDTSTLAMNGSMTQSGGSVDATTASVNGDYDLTSGTLTAATAFNIGTASAGTFDNTGGTVVSATTTVGADGTYSQSAGTETHSAITINSGGSHTLSGTGSLTATNINLTGTMVQTGGTLNTPASTTVFSGGNLAQSGGNATHTTLAVNSGGTAAVSGTATLNATTLTAGGTVVQSGGTINATTLNANHTVNQSGGTANAKLNVGSGGNYNLTGGTLNSTVASDVTVDGTLTINGGTLSQDLNSANDVTEFNGSGVIVLESGLLQTTNGIPQSVVNLRANMEISGGTLDLGGQSRLYNDLMVIGDAATIQIDRLGANRASASFTFKLGASGVSTIEGVGGYAVLSGASLLVDGTDYVYGGGTFTNLLFNPDNLASTFNLSDVTITNFADGLTVNFFQDQSAGADWVGIEIIPEPAVLSLIVIFGGSILVLKRRFS